MSTDGNHPDSKQPYTAYYWDCHDPLTSTTAQYCMRLIYINPYSYYLEVALSAAALSPLQHGSWRLERIGTSQMNMTEAEHWNTRNNSLIITNQSPCYCMWKSWLWLSKQLTLSDPVLVHPAANQHTVEDSARLQPTSHHTHLKCQMSDAGHRPIALESFANG